jgi:YihY family inner membrane protein
MNIIQKAVSRLDALQRKRHFIGFPLAVSKKYGDDEASHYAALLTYYGFLSIFPLLLVLATLLRFFLRGEGELQRKILQGVTDYIPVIGSQLGKSVHSMDKAGLALAIGTILTLYGARGVADIYRNMVNHVWQVPYSKRPGFPGSIVSSLVIILVGGAGLIIAPLSSGFAVSFGHLWIFRLLALLLTTGVLFLLLLFVTHLALADRRPLKDFWVGSLVGAIGIVLLQAIGNYLIVHQLKHLQDLYSTFAIVLGLLYWLFLQAQLLLYALEIDSVRAFKLWPRSLVRENPTKADDEAYDLYARRNSWRKDDVIQVRNRNEKRPVLERLMDVAEEQLDNRSNKNKPRD